MAGVRIAARATLILLALVACLPLHYATRLLTGRSGWPRRFLALAARAAGARVTVTGTVLRSYVLFVANHRSWADILVLAGATGCAFVSKAEVARWPVIGWLAALNHTVFIERARRSHAARQADALGIALTGGRPVALFPEGTTHDGAEMLPFRAALFGAVAPPPPGVRVQPVLIDYGRPAREIAWGDDESATANVLRLLGRAGTVAVTLHFLDPLPQSDDRKALAVMAREAISAAAGSAPHRP